ncbi:MAG TPA: glycoside hydrolase family 140 protein [Bacteroidales bacterium]|nr:glycoside hydrolase family 140 protein [Bacteroidales bacterium]
MKKILYLSLIFMFFCSYLRAQDTWPHGRIIVSDNGHFLKYEDGTPFFWLGDTGWEMFHRLKMSEIDQYLSNRAEKGFTVIQAVLIAENDGLRTPDKEGQLPLIDLDPTKPNEKYFRFVDSVVRLARSKGLVMGLLPTWGDKVSKFWGVGPVIFNEKNAYTYGHWLGERYKDDKNIIWILGGDRPPANDTADWRPVWRAMGKGMIDGTGNHALIAYHPSGWQFTSDYFQNEAWLDVNMMQSGHGSGHDVPVWEWIIRDWNMVPHKPTLDAEPNYEDHPVSPWPKWNPANGYFRDYDVRKQTYRSVFAGACGVTYGNHSVWQFYNPSVQGINHVERFWYEALDRPGAVQMGYLRNLMESRPQLDRIPDQLIILDGQGEKGEHICATRDGKGSYLMVYLPVGKKITINTSSIHSDRIVVSWFNPANGKLRPLGEMDRQDSMSFIPPELGAGNDWVLITDDPLYHYSLVFR